MTFSYKWCMAFSYKVEDIDVLKAGKSYIIREHW